MEMVKEVQIAIFENLGFNEMTPYELFAVGIWWDCPRKRKSNKLREGLESWMVSEQKIDFLAQYSFQLSIANHDKTYLSKSKKTNGIKIESWSKWGRISRKSVELSFMFKPPLYLQDLVDFYSPLVHVPLLIMISIFLSFFFMLRFDPVPQCLTRLLSLQMLWLMILSSKKFSKLLPRSTLTRCLTHFPFCCFLFQIESHFFFPSSIQYYIYAPFPQQISILLSNILVQTKNTSEDFKYFSTLNSQCSPIPFVNFPVVQWPVNSLNVNSQLLLKVNSISQFILVKKPEWLLIGTKPRAMVTSTVIKLPMMNLLNVLLVFKILPEVGSNLSTPGKKWPTISKALHMAFKQSTSSQFQEKFNKLLKKKLSRWLKKLRWFNWFVQIFSFLLHNFPSNSAPLVITWSNHIHNVFQERNIMYDLDLTGRRPTTDHINT